MSTTERAVQWREGAKWSKVHRVYLNKAVCGAAIGPHIIRVSAAGLDSASFYGGLCPTCYETQGERAR